VLGSIVFGAIYGAYSIEYAAGRAEVAERLRWLRIMLLAEPRSNAASA
jgi:hypothetical protein